MPDDRPVSVTLCVVTSAGSRMVVEPYAVVGPYLTWDVEPSLVVQVIVAPLLVGLPAVTVDMVGGVVSAAGAVVKVKSVEVARLFAASALRTW